MADQAIAPAAERPRTTVTAKKKGSGIWLFLGLAILAGGAGAAWYFGVASKSRKSAEAGEGSHTGVTKVTVSRPTPHGIERVVQQPGDVRAFEAADLYAKVSGYMKSQSVDIGSPVKAHQELAEIEDPELVKAQDQAKAAVDQAQAAVTQAEAHVRTADAMKKTAVANVATARSELERRKSSREYRKKQFERIKGLVLRHAVEEQLQDEEQDKYDASIADYHAAEAGVLSADASVAEAQAKVEQAQADLVGAKSNVEVAQAALDKAKVLVGYTKIVSPYDGVVTLRNFHPGAFIRSASDGNEKPILSVARIDKVRVVVQVPDPDVPLVDVGDPAIVHIDSLPGREFKGTVSRFSYSQDPGNRTMRTEIDLPNSDNLLREGMYGGVTIVLEPASKNLSVPSSALFEGSEGKGFVYVVRDGKLHKTPVVVALDNGVAAEIASGLGAEDEVVIKYNGALADNMAVEVEQAQGGESAKPAH